jgi:hypothetical protein
LVTWNTRPDPEGSITVPLGPEPVPRIVIA